MKINSLFAYPANLVGTFIKLSKNQNPFAAFRFLLLENYYYFKYKVNTPYRNESGEITNQLAAQKDAFANVPGSYYLFHVGLSKVDIPADKISFLDIGCGTGRFTSVGIQKGFAFTRGIDLDKNGLEIANQNAAFSIAKTGRPGKYEITFQDASLYHIPLDVNLIYFFNPFGEKTMQCVVNNIVQSYALKPRDIYVIYNLPGYESLFTNANFERIYLLAYKNRAELSVLKLRGKGIASQ